MSLFLAIIFMVLLTIEIPVFAHDHREEDGYIVAGCAIMLIMDLLYLLDVKS